MFVIVGISHKTASIDIRERFALPQESLSAFYESLRDEGSIGEAVVLSTCNRVEIYAAPKEASPEESSIASLDEVALSLVNQLTRMGGHLIESALFRAQGRDAARHLFRVASSLDSLVIGEPQILGQLKDAIELSRQNQFMGSRLGSVMHRALRVAKRVRTDTRIGAGSTSVSSVAVDLAHQIFGGLSGKKALLIGAGEMAESAARSFTQEGVSLSIVNRSFERGEDLARMFGGKAHAYGDLDRELAEADIVLCSTGSSSFIVTEETMKPIMKKRRGRSLFLIDIAVPRNIDPQVNALDNVYLYDIDDLAQAQSRATSERSLEAAAAETIVREECELFEAWVLERALNPTIVGLRTRTQETLTGELDRTLKGRLRHLPEGDREALRLMLESATNKLLHVPTSRLRALASDPRASDYLDAIHDLFALPSPMPSAPPPASPHAALDSEEKPPAVHQDGMGSKGA